MGLTEASSRTLSRIREKIDAVRAIESEQRCGTIVETGTALRPIPELPPGTTEVFSLFGRLAGSNFSFTTPPEIRSPENWRGHQADNSALGESLEIGFELVSVGGGPSADGPQDDERVGAPIRMDVADGHVYYLDPEDYIFLYKNPTAAGVEVLTLAADPITFFDRMVLGPGYTALVAGILGAEVVDERHRKTGEYTDSWRRLLNAGGLSD